MTQWLIEIGKDESNVLFKNSETLEKFEQSLNDPQTGINNLDLDQNGQVDSEGSTPGSICAGGEFWEFSRFVQNKA